MRHAVRLAVGVAAILTILGSLALWGAWRISAPGPLEQDVVVEIPRGTGLYGIARRLHEVGVVEVPLLLVAAAKLSGVDRELQAGEYRFPAGVSIEGALRMLREGDVVVHSITVPEGLTSVQVADLLRAEPALTGEITEVPPEGSLLPETYHFVRGESRMDLLARMRRAMEAELARLWAQRAEGLPLATPEEAVVLASIVEKETAVPSERARVAGVFINRLERGMRLQSDPTVIYALTGGQGPLDRPLTRADWQAESPYNTYRNAGLPPGPIANPGRAALAAVLNPERHDYLYFVADGSGGHAFARTLHEHNRNVARWRRLRQQSGPSAD